ncbi:hypothetical protein [Acinetobacter sp. 243_ASPC]|uniref:hypothetical protein n=1 Tax=Acinetobacter sp. 243_ASPC TaxID=1579345 RepID=UPI00065F6CA0|nr:hypothetical protein [Acinetobacter sp. 243_ASPC]
MIDLELERKLFQDFLDENYDFENHEETYFDKKTQCYVNDGGEDTESLNVAWEVHKKCAESKQAEIDSLKAQLAKIESDEYVDVPREPTDKTIAHMINTPIEVNLLCDHADTFLSEDEAYIAYQAMIEAAQENSHE